MGLSTCSGIISVGGHPVIKSLEVTAFVGGGVLLFSVQVFRTIGVTSHTRPHAYKTQVKY